MKFRQNITAIIKDKRGRILSIGKNSYLKSHPMQKKFAEAEGLPEKIYLHAELDAIIKCQHLNKAHSIHIFRFGKKNQPLLAAPCPICLSAIRKSKIKHIFHT